MQYSVKDLKGYAIGATDGDIGKLDDFYFDDEFWTIRYLVTETGNWLLNRKVLISPFALDQGGFSQGAAQCDADKEASARRAPALILTSRFPGSTRRITIDYYGYPYYWNGPYLWGPTYYPQLSSRRSKTN